MESSEATSMETLHRFSIDFLSGEIVSSLRELGLL